MFMYVTVCIMCNSMYEPVCMNQSVRNSLYVTVCV